MENGAIGVLGLWSVLCHVGKGQGHVREVAWRQTRVMRHLCINYSHAWCLNAQVYEKYICYNAYDNTYTYIFIHIHTYQFTIFFHLFTLVNG